MMIYVPTVGNARAVPIAIPTVPSIILFDFAVKVQLMFALAVRVVVCVSCA